MNEEFDFDFLDGIDPDEIRKAAKVAKADMKAEASNKKPKEDAKESRGHNKESSRG